jgi:hypothetical protein
MEEKTSMQKIGDMTGFTSDEVAVIKNTVAKGTTDLELAYFLNVSKSVGLSPFNKEVWCYKDGKGNLLVFAGRDGFLKKGQQDARWNGIVSSEVCMNDIFEMDIPNGMITHKPNFKDRGAIIGAYCYIKPKNCDTATIEWAEFKTYDKGYSVWKADPAAMIKKVAETHCLKKAFGISGIQAEYDFDVKQVGGNAVVVPINEVPDEYQQKKEELIRKLTDYQGEDKEVIKAECKKAVATEQLTLEFIDTKLKHISDGTKNK